MRPTRAIRCDCFENRRRRATRTRRNIRRNLNVISLFLSIRRTTKYGSIATMSMIVIELQRNFFRCGAHIVLRISSMRKNVLRTTSSMDQGFFSNLTEAGISSAGTLCRHEETTDRTTEKESEKSYSNFILQSTPIGWP